jgi:hypothetical protein
MSFSGSQQADLMQSALAGSYDWYLEREGAWLGDSSEGSINIPWILSIALAEGNAATVALGETANIFPEPEWGFDAGGAAKDIGPQEQMWIGGGVGGFIVSW